MNSKTTVKRLFARVSVLIAITALTLSATVRFAYADEPQVPSCAVWQASGQWDNMDFGDYTLYNNIWGDGAGEQSIWACDHGHFGVWADHPDTSGVKSYPNSAYFRPLGTNGVAISEIGSLTSVFDFTVPTAGNHATTYDIWSGRKTEIMLWLNKQGDHGPWAGAWDANGDPIPDASNVSCGGHTWDQYYNGGVRGFNVYSMVRTTNTTSGEIDILSCLQWLKNNTNLGDPAIDNVQLGFEISGSPGGMNFTMNSYDVFFNGDGGGDGGGTNCSLPAWDPGATYIAGDFVSHLGNDWEWNFHKSGNIEPPHKKWTDLGPCS